MDNVADKNNGVLDRKYSSTSKVCEYSIEGTKINEIRQDLLEPPLVLEKDLTEKVSS